MLIILWNTSHLPSPVPTTHRRRNKELDMGKGRSGGSSSHESDIGHATDMEQCTLPLPTAQTRWSEDNTSCSSPADRTF